MKQVLSKKKILYFSLGIFILVSGIFAVNALIAGTRHAPTNILVTINSQKMTLQEAIGGATNYLADSATLPTIPGTTFLSVGHNPEEIWVSVDGTENTLDYFLSNSISLCATGVAPAYTNYNLNPGHRASEIQYNATRNLQQAIDQGVFCCVDAPTSTTCSGLCGAQTNNCGNPVDCGACCTDPCNTDFCITGDTYCRYYELSCSNPLGTTTCYYDTSAAAPLPGIWHSQTCTSYSCISGVCTASTTTTQVQDSSWAVCINNGGTFIGQTLNNCISYWCK